MSSESGGFFSGLVVGGAIGLLAGILFAPKAGRDLREELLTDNEDILGKAKDELDKIRDDLNELKNRVVKPSGQKKQPPAPAETDEEREFEAGINSLDDEPEKKEK